MSNLTLYDADFSPPCQAVRLVARALNLKLQLTEMDMFKKLDHKTPQFLKINPAHTIPTLDDNGLHIWESRAIMAYLVQQYGKDDKLYPKEAKKRAVVDNMLNFDLGSLYPSLIEVFMPLLKMKPQNEESKTKLEEKLSILDGILGGRAYAGGDHLTIADISILCTLFITIVIEYDMKRFANITAWMDRVKKGLPFYDEVTAKGFDHYRVIVKGMIG